MAVSGRCSRPLAPRMLRDGLSIHRPDRERLGDHRVQDSWSLTGQLAFDRPNVTLVKHSAQCHFLISTLSRKKKKLKNPQDRELMGSGQESLRCHAETQQSGKGHKSTLLLTKDIWTQLREKEEHIHQKFITAALQKTST